MKLDLKSSPRHIKRLQNIAKVISGLGDVRVVIDDNTKGPYFDPVNKVCVLPNGDYSDDDFVSLIEGFTCHEAGHGRYTDSEVYSDAFNSVLKKSAPFQATLMTNSSIACRLLQDLVSAAASGASSHWYVRCSVNITCRSCGNARQNQNSVLCITPGA